MTHIEVDSFRRCFPRSPGHFSTLFYIQALAKEIGFEIRIAHYPPYTSKWNPIEHRVFPHITRAMSGMILTSHQFMKELIENTTTKAGLKVFACIFNRIYETGRKVV